MFESCWAHHPTSLGGFPPLIGLKPRVAHGLGARQCESLVVLPAMPNAHQQSRRRGAVFIRPADQARGFAENHHDTPVAPGGRLLERVDHVTPGRLGLGHRRRFDAVELKRRPAGIDSPGAGLSNQGQAAMYLANLSGATLPPVTIATTLPAA